MSQFGEPLKGLKEDIEGTKPTKVEIERAKKREDRERQTQPMTEDLLSELRRHQRDYPSLIHSELCGQAADRIEELEGALRKCRTSINGYAITKSEQYPEVVASFLREIRRIDGIARAAISSAER